MSVPTSKIVSVTVTETPVFPPGQNFSNLVIVDGSAALPTGAPLQVFTSVATAALVLGAGEALNAVTVFFTQNPSPSQVLVGRRYAAVTPGELLGSTALDTKIADYVAVGATGALSLLVDGTAVNLTALNLTGVTTLNGVAAIVQTALAAVKAGATCVYNGQQFLVRSGTTGITSSVGFSTPPPTGTPIGILMGLNQLGGAVSTLGAATETITASLTRLQSYASSALAFFGVTFTREVTPAQLLEAAAWCTASGCLLAYTTADPNSLNIADTTNLGYQMKQLAYKNAIGQYDPIDPYAIVSAIAEQFSEDLTQPNSLGTLKFKLEPGIVPLQVSESQRLALEFFNLNYYTTFGTSALIAEGVMASGDYFDVIYGLAWLQNLIGTNVFGYLYVQPKVQQTDAGVAQVLQVIHNAMDAAVNNGLVAPGQWQGQPVGPIKHGQTLPTGYYVYAPSVATQSQADRDARKSPPITILAIGAGAIHSVNIALTFQQ